MHHRIVSTVVVIIVALFVAASGLFAWAVAAVSPPSSDSIPAPDNPHPPATQTDACLQCHNLEQESIPITHRHYSENTCASCHRQAIRVLVPHSIAMGDERCPLCHGEPARDHGVPESHLRYESGECLLCHPVDDRFRDRQPPPAGLSRSVTDPMPHPTDGIFEDCNYCHHVEPRSTLPDNHRDFAMETCLDCHEPEESGADR